MLHELILCSNKQIASSIECKAAKNVQKGPFSSIAEGFADEKVSPAEGHGILPQALDSLPQQLSTLNYGTA